MSNRPAVELYTDGACDPNPGPGGWAAILVSGPHHKELSGAADDTTNNRMELQAVIAGLEALKGPSTVTVHTDSRYVQQGVTEWLAKWQSSDWLTSQKTPVKNQDLWQQLAATIERHDITWQWLKGHAGHPLNERADRLAVAQIPRPAPEGDHEAAVYVGVSCQSPQGRGAWAAITVHGDTRVIRSGVEHDTTANRLLIRAAFEGLRLLPFKLATRVFTRADYLYKGATEWLAGWQRRDWKTSAGQPVANAKDWEALAAQLELRTVSWFNPKRDDLPELDEAAAEAERLMRDPTAG